MIHIKYDSKNNQYVCTEGKILKYSSYSKKRGHYSYRIDGRSNCIGCVNFGVCTTSKRGRSITRLKDEKLKEQLGLRYDSESGQGIYKKRKEKVELVFGHIKRTLNGGAFLVRGLKAVRGEMTIFANCFNIARMITLLGGVEQMVDRLEALRV